MRVSVIANPVRVLSSLFWLSVSFGLNASTLSSSQQDVTVPPLKGLAELTVTVCGNSAYPPVTWVNSQGQTDGVNVAVMRLLLEPLGVTLDTRQNSNWRRCLKEVELGNVDILSGFKTKRRQEFAIFLDAPVIRETIYLYYPIKQPLKFTDWTALSGLRVGVLMGDSFGTEVDAALQQYPRLEFVSTQDQNLLKLADNRLDVVPMGKLSGQLDLQRLGLKEQIGYTETDVNDFWYIAMSKHSLLVPWLPLLNQRLNYLLKDPDLVNKLVERYYQIYTTDLGLDIESDDSP